MNPPTLFPPNSSSPVTAHPTMLPTSFPGTVMPTAALNFHYQVILSSPESVTALMDPNSPQLQAFAMLQQEAATKIWKCLLS